MKTKLKIIVITFVATTAFWCLFIVVFFRLSPGDKSVRFIEDAGRRGYIATMYATNGQSRPVTFTVEELRTNNPSADVVLLERQVPPSGDFWIGIKRESVEKKP